MLLNGLGTLDLAAANTFTGGVTIDEGTLELSNSAAAGSGGITFATGADATIELDSGVFAPNPISGFATGDALRFIGAGSATLAGPASGGEIDFSPSAVDYARLKSGSKLGATISGLTTGDAVDFEAVKYASTDKLVYAKGVVSIKNSADAQSPRSDVSGTHTAANFKLSNDGSGHILVSYARRRQASPPRNRRRQPGRPSWTVRFRSSPSRRGNADSAVSFDPWLPPVLERRELYGGFSYRPDGNFGGARDAGASARLERTDRSRAWACDVRAGRLGLRGLTNARPPMADEPPRAPGSVSVSHS